MNRQGYIVNATDRECTKCSSMFKITSKMTICTKCNSTRVKSQPIEKRMLARAKSRAKLKGREFAITANDIHIPDTCPVLGIPLVTSSGKSGGTPNSPSLDRLDSSRGYTPDNIIVMSQRANLMKADATLEDILKLAEWAKINM